MNSKSITRILALAALLFVTILPAVAHVSADELAVRNQKWRTRLYFGIRL